MVAEPQNYKNLKTPDDTGRANTYKITKITGDITVKVTLGKIIAGDLDFNGRITSADVVNLRRYLVSRFTPVDRRLADVNGDKRITANDVLALQRKLALR